MRLFKRGANAPGLAPADVRAAILAAYDAGDAQALLAVCKTNEATILASFTAWWADHPPTDQPEALNRYIQAMATTATIFDGQLHHPELLAGIMGGGGGSASDPYRRIAAAGERMADGHYEDARESLAAFIDELPNWTGPGVVDLSAKAHGALGRTWLAVGRADEAIAPWERALAECRSEADADGVSVYTHCLFDAHRYLGNRAPAAEYAAAHAAALDAAGRPGAAWFRGEAGIVARGEPLLRVLAWIDDRRYELDDAAELVRSSGAVDHPVKFEAWRNRPSIERVDRLAGEAGALGSARRLPEALDRFNAAADLDPFDPNPRYNAGVALLELERFADARRQFEEVESLAPGWFWVRRYQWLAEQVEHRRLPAPVASALIIGGEQSVPPAQRLQLIEPLRSAIPNLAWAHLIAAEALLAMDRGRDAIAAMRAGLAGDGDPDVRCTLLVKLGSTLGLRDAEARRLFEEAIRVGGSTQAHAAAMIAVASGAAGQRLN